MKVLVDTCVWSLALRRRNRSEPDPITSALATLVADARVAMIGPVRQEVLSGIRDREQFERLRESLRAFPDLPIEAADYEEAASFYNRCRERGIQGSNTDFLICAVAVRRACSILTTDDDFRRFASILPIVLIEPYP